MNLWDRVNIRLRASEHEFRFAFYSPRRNDIALVKSIEVWVDKNNQKYVNHKRENGVYGQTTRLDIFEKRFPVFIGDVGLGTDYFDLKKKLNDPRDY